MSELFDVIVIGSGPGGYVAAIRAAQLGFKTACVEKDPYLGGVCLNVGCIPSKALLQSTELYYKMVHHGKEYGIEGNIELNFAQMMKRKNSIVSGFNTGIASLFKKNKITKIQGTATFTSSETITVAGKEIRGKNFILATGSEPMPLPFLPFDEKKVISSTGALSLQEIPKKMIVVGAGVIGVELGSVYSRLGTEVHFIEFLDRICPTLDKGLSKALEHSLTKQGLTFALKTKVIQAKINDKVDLTIEKPNGGQEQISSDLVLVSIGRMPYTKELGLEAIGIKTDPKGFIPINGSFQTSLPHIFAIGDIVDGPMLAHKASEEGSAVAEILAGMKPHIEYIAIPNVVYTHPEVASVGLTVEQTKEMHISTKIGQFPMKANSRARASSDDEGFIKIISEEKTGRIIGVHIISAIAGELIAEATLAIENRLTVDQLANTCHPHPTFSEALKEAALSITKKALHI